MLRRYWLAAIAGSLMLLAGAAGAAIPGPQRGICPHCYGLADIGDDIFTDVPERKGEIHALVADADAAIGEFFGGLMSHPRYIICSSPACFAAFGGGPTGITYGWQLISIAPHGMRPTIVTHERLHAELAARIGLRSLFDEPVPVWFNEGLATYLARDPRFPGPFSAADVAWIKGGVSRPQWNELLKERGWIAGYGAAQAAVASLVAQIGPPSVRDMLLRIAAGTPFDTALADATR